MGVLVIDSEDKYSQTELGPPVFFPRLSGSSLTSQSISRNISGVHGLGRFTLNIVVKEQGLELGIIHYLFLYTNECNGIDYIRTQAIHLQVSQSLEDFASQLANKVRLHKGRIVEFFVKRLVFFIIILFRRPQQVFAR